jgi:hypothetical protein
LPRLLVSASGVDDQHRAVPEVILVHQVEDLAQLGVTHAQRSRILPQVLDLLRGLLHRAARRPVKVGTVVVVGVERFWRMLHQKRALPTTANPLCAKYATCGILEFNDKPHLQHTYT